MNTTKNNSKKLVLFDIDGTLITWAGKHINGFSRFQHGMKDAWGIDIGNEIDSFEGVPEWKSAWEVAKQYGVNRTQFEKKFSVYVEAMRVFLADKSKTFPLYVLISEAVELVALLHRQKDVHMGILSANPERIGKWKLEHCGLHNYFEFGLWGDKAESRIEIAQSVFKKANDFFNYSFPPQDIIVVGDTIHDIQCGKAIGSVTIAVTTGRKSATEILASVNPDLLVDSLMDRRVHKLLGLTKDK